MADHSTIKLERSFGGTHGFHRTSEGRSFLREMYKVYLRQPETGKERKVASIIAGTADMRTVKSALKRWRGGQADLWVHEAEAKLEVMERLERLLMAYEPVRELLDDQASTIHKRDVGSSLGILTYGVHVKNEVGVENALKSTVGLFYVEEQSWGSGKYNIEYYVYYARPSRERYLVFQEFALDRRSLPNIRMSYRKSGYAVPTLDNKIIRFVANHTNPSIRQVEVLYEDDRRIDDEYRIVYSRYGHSMMEENEEEDRKIISYVPDNNRFIVNYVEKLLWDIVL